jgi:hypothetical protein
MSHPSIAARCPLAGRLLATIAVAAPIDSASTAINTVSGFLDLSQLCGRSPSSGLTPD